MTTIDQLEQMRMGVEYRHPISIRKFSCIVRPLSITETLEVAEIVADLMAKMPESARTRLHEHTILAQETLKRASTPDIDSREPGAITDFILKRMTPDEIHSLYKQWADVCEKCSPKLEELPADKVKELAEGLKKSPSLVTELSFSQLVAVAQYLLTRDG